MTKMDNDFIDNFLRDFDDSRYPIDFLQNYETLECLANNQMGETLLVKEKQTGNFCVAKCYSDKSLLSHSTESDLLKIFDNDRLPAFIAEYQNEGMLCVVREYIKGISLDKYVARHKLSQDQIISIVVKLCDDISYLHTQKPPIIHRDIKPQNIVMDESGNPRLIDFGSSRVYDVDAQEDTVCFGTRNFAAPEQYGFSQTDCRTDIFSLGVLIGWLLTGETETKKSIPAITSLPVSRIVKKCTAFSPENRYASVNQVKTALLNINSQRQRLILQWLIIALTCTAFLCLGFVVGRFTEFAPSLFAGTSIKFEEPIIEQAVRLSLGKQNSDPILKEELLAVTELYIYGDKAFNNYKEFETWGEHMVLNDGTIQNGGITSLKDLSGLKNLKRLNIAFENISDLSPLNGLEKLEQVVLKHNPIEDVTPLAGLPFLKEVILFDTWVTDLNALSSCPMLDTIDIGATYITSIDAIKELSELTTLSIRNIELKSLAGIEELSQLRTIRLGGVTDEDLLPLLSLEKLEKLYVDESFRNSTGNFLKSPKFEIVFDR